MKDALISRIRKYYAFQFFNSLGFFFPVIVLFWQSHGLTMTQIMLLQSIYSIGVIILELPTGAFADYFGKRKSLILGAAFWSVGFIWYGASTHFWQFVVGELVVGIGSAFISGADRVYIHELLKEENKEHEFKKTEGKARGIIQIASAIASIGGGIIGSISLAFTLFATGIATFVSLIVGLSFPGIKEDKKTQKRIGFVQTIKESVLLIRSHKRLLWLTLFFACFYGLLWPLNLYTQPFLKLLGVPVLYFGFAFFVINLIVGVGSAFTHQFELFTKKYVFIIMSAIVVFSLFLIVLTKNIFVFPLWSLFLTFIFMNQTIISDKVLQIVPAQQATTVLSFQSLLRRLVYAMVGPILGIATDMFGIQTALFYYAIFLACILGSLLVSEGKFKA